MIIGFGRCFDLVGNLIGSRFLNGLINNCFWNCGIVAEAIDVCDIASLIVMDLIGCGIIGIVPIVINVPCLIECIMRPHFSTTGIHTDQNGMLRKNVVKLIGFSSFQFQPPLEHVTFCLCSINGYRCRFPICQIFCRNRSYFFNIWNRLTACAQLHPSNRTFAKGRLQRIGNGKRFGCIGTRFIPFGSSIAIRNRRFCHTIVI